MSLQTGQFIETPGAPQVDAYPHVSLGTIENNIGAGGSLIVPQAIGGLASTGTDWIVGASTLISGHILAGNALGGCLEIYLSMDGITFDSWQPIWLIGLQVTFFGPIEFPGYNARFRIWNNDGGLAQLFQGLIFMKGF